MRCSRCSTALRERHAILRRVSDENGKEKLLVVYTCPACGFKSETPPKPEELKAWAVLTKGVALQAQARLREALGCFEHVLSINPEFAMAWYNKGCILSNLRRFPEALECYNRALAIDP